MHRMTIPCKSSKKTYQIPVNPLKLHCLLLLVSAAPPPKMSYTFVVVGESPASATRHLKSGREDKALLSIPATETSPYDSDWPNVSLAVLTPTTEMQLPEVDQGQLNPELTAGREKLPQQLRVFVLPQPQAAKHISVCHDHFHTHSDDCYPAPHINYHKRGGRSAHCSR